MPNKPTSEGSKRRVMQMDKLKTAEALFKRAYEEMMKEPPNVGDAYRLLQRAAGRGYGEAIYALATWHLYGQEPFVSKDVRKANEMFKRAAEMGVPAAMYDLGVSYEKGVGLRKSPRKAFALYLSAAIKGDPDAVREVAECFRYGYGTHRDMIAARIWKAWANEITGQRTSVALLNRSRE